jgi:hypothetical protein
MLVQHALDLGGIDVLAAADDHVLPAVHEAQIAVLVAAGRRARRRRRSRHLVDPAAGGSDEIGVG